MYKKIISIVVFALLIPSVLFISFFLFEDKKYYLSSVMIALLALIPFFVSLERRKLQARELVTIASVIAIAVAGRAAFFMLPQIKPLCAIVIMASISFGANIGFICGSLSMLISNFIFGQGPFTPFQMFGMGLTALVCGLIFNNKKNPNRIIIALTGGVACIFIYGFIVDSQTALYYISDLNFKSMIPVYVAGFKFNLIHAITTFIILMIAFPSVSNTFNRIAVKYKLFGVELK